MNAAPFTIRSIPFFLVTDAGSSQSNAVPLGLEGIHAHSSTQGEHTDLLNPEFEEVTIPPMVPQESETSTQRTFYTRPIAAAQSLGCDEESLSSLASRSDTVNSTPLH
jgi:hypothetical protein